MTRPPWCFLVGLTIAELIAFAGSPIVVVPACALGGLGALLDCARWGWLRVPPRGGE